MLTFHRIHVCFPSLLSNFSRSAAQVFLRPIRRSGFSLLLLLLLPGLCPAAAETTGSLRLARVFGDSMVIQRDKPIAVWGWTTPGTKVAVSLAGSKAEGTADSSGKWSVTLDPLPAGGPHSMAVSGDGTLTLSDVLVGEVWICSGQSNMNWSLSRTFQGNEEAAKANYPNIRLFQVPRLVGMKPEADLRDGKWDACTSESAARFSAVGYYFGRELHQHLKVPVGLIHTSWGGTGAQAWTSETGLESLPAFRDHLEAQQKAGTDEKSLKKWWEAEAKAWDQRAEALDAGSTGSATWADPSVGTSDWGTIQLPPGTDQPGGRSAGITWFRRDVEVPEELAKGPAVLKLGQIQDADVAWVNGVKVGATEGGKPSRAYKIKEGILRPGKNTVAVRVWNSARMGRFSNSTKVFQLESQNGKSSVSLAGDWKWKVGADLSELRSRPPEPTGPTRLGGLFNGMVAPLVPVAFKGVIWYQGENNAYRPQEYGDLLANLIRDWRRAWGGEEFPFLFVQLPNFEAWRSGASAEAWPLIREAQLRTTREVPGTGMAVAIDQGDPKDIHPTRKTEVARRLFLQARKVAYGENVVASGPIYRPGSVKADGQGGMRLEFEFADGIGARDGAIRGFEAAGKDGAWHPAEAVVEAGGLVVKSPAVQDPVAVRYAWANNPEANLINGEGLPASPFRTEEAENLTRER